MNNRYFFLTVWETENSRSGCPHGQVRALFQVRLLTVSLRRAARGEGVLLELLIRALTPLVRGLSLLLLLFICPVMSDSLRPRGLQHARPPCPSPSPGVCPSSSSLHWWCHPTISSSVIPFSSCMQHQGLFKWVSSSYQWPNYWSFSSSISLSNEYSVLISFRIDWLMSLQSKGFSSVFSNTTVQKHQFYDTQLCLWPNSHIHTWLLEKP